MAQSSAVYRLLVLGRPPDSQAASVAAVSGDARPRCPVEDTLVKFAGLTGSAASRHQREVVEDEQLSVLAGGWPVG